MVASLSPTSSRSLLLSGTSSLVTTSSRYPQANGEAEQAVKTAKMILKQDDIFLALLTYRATPIPELGRSPAELAFNRRLRTTLPALPTTLKPREVDQESLRQRDAAFKQKQKKNHDRRHGARPLPELRPGDPVLFLREGNKEKQPAVVLEKCAPRSYVLQTPSGNVRRNRRHVWSLPT
jgi:hypothetical protein